ncbi:MAG TPA: hypothetical protein P5548_01680 [Candidatus Moranbacteria bacterium]|nr:hypothetical protein [Candidatus Moranbacteria bacterium]HRZ33592.1 hypothetical protein [Candidatus Moranbacteria bacterium]
MRKKNKKLVYLATILCMLFLQTFPAPVYLQAASVSSDLSQEDEDEITIAQQTAEGKKEGPKVEIRVMFPGGVPQTGASATAEAVVAGFSGDNLYYTWYLKNKDCDLTDEWWDKDGGADGDSCDLDNDNVITPNDWKLAALRYAGQNSAEGDTSAEAGIEAVPSVEDDDGWIKTWKRESGNKYEAENCYVQEPVSGLIYELRKTEPIFKTPCPDDYPVPACVEDRTMNCEVLDPAFTGTEPVCDPTNTSPPNTIPPFYDANACWELKHNDMNFSGCMVKSIASSTGEAGMKQVFNCTTKSEDYKLFHAYLSCKNGGTPICMPASGNFNMIDNNKTAPDNIRATIVRSEGAFCSSLGKPNTNIGLLAPPPGILDEVLYSSEHENCSYLTQGLINGVKSDGTISGVFVEDSNSEVTGNPDLEPSCSFGPALGEEDNLCKHLFPYDPDENFKPGDGQFKTNEKNFYFGENFKGKADEATVIGLGAKKFNWTYTDGDEIGVVVEGESQLAGPHNDSKNMIMWAFSKGKCDELKDIVGKEMTDGGTNGTATTAFYKDPENNKGILTTDFDLDRCLEENLVDPLSSDATGGVSYAFETKLSATPTNPLNDPEGLNSDTLTVQAMSKNSGDLKDIYYEWKVEAFTSPPTESSTGGQDVKIGSLSGLGKSKISFPLTLDIEGDIFYLRITVKTTDNNSGQSSQGQVIVKVRNQTETIKVREISYSASGISIGSQICNGQGEAICPVTQNKLVAVEVDGGSGYSWKVNGQSMECLSTLCQGFNGLIFPIIGNPGESVNVVARGTNQNGVRQEITQRFVIVGSYAQISSASGAMRKFMGTYYTVDNNEVDSFSNTVMEAKEDTRVSLTATAGNSFGQKAVFEWYLDGVQVLDGDASYGNDDGDITISSTGDSSTFEFTVKKEAKDSYLVGYKVRTAKLERAEREGLNALRKELKDKWGISPLSSNKDIYVNQEFVIEVTKDPITFMKSPQKAGIFASLITNLPEQMLFLLRITVTSIVLVFSMGIIFSLMPESIFEKKE